MSDSAPLVSIIMPVFNAESHLARSIGSVQSQTYSKWELIAVDDHSTDRSQELLQHLSASEPRIRILRQPKNQGAAAARNAALQICSGDYVAFLDSDDQWLPQKLAIQVAYAERSGSVLTYCSYSRVSEPGQTLEEVWPPEVAGYRDMLAQNHIPMLTAMYRRSIWPEHRFRSIGHEDYVFWTELIRKTGAASRVPSDSPLARYTVRSGSLSANKGRAALWHWQNLRRDFGLPLVEAGLYFLRYATRHALRLEKLALLRRLLRPKC